MKTRQLVERKFQLAEQIYGRTVQDSTDYYFNATPLVKAYNAYAKTNKRVENYLRLSTTKEFVESLCRIENIQIKNISHVRRGKTNTGLWMHPFLFIDFAMWLSPEIKVWAIRWLHDNLIKYRKESGDSYRQLTGALLTHYVERYDKKPDKKYYKKEANLIKELVGLEPEESWNTATEYQLGLRKQLHKAAIMAHKARLMRKKRILFLKQAKLLYALEHKNIDASDETDEADSF